MTLEHDTSLVDKEVINFINLFQCEQTIDLFTQGLCYWFAHILHTRFPYKLFFHEDGLTNEASTIVYNAVEGHFMTKIGKRLYDIRGDVTSLYASSECLEHLIDFESLKLTDPPYYGRILQYCVLKIDDK